MSVWGTVPAWLAAAIALFASILAIRQFKLATKAQQDQVQIARANLMLAIDKTFESDMLNSRKAVRSLRNRAQTSRTRIRSSELPMIAIRN